MIRTVLTFLAIAGCGDTVSTPAAFPADYKASYVQVRPCRSSSDHDLHHVRVLADPLGLDPYSMRNAPFPVGSVILKEEYDIGDSNCTGALTDYTVMVKLAAGSSPATLDWHWQRVDSGRNVVSDDEPHCYTCHKMCGVPPDGYQGTCEVP
ncbi:MAG: hypothetical protein JWO36_7502 [Myxococcales bacterium]|nr:hypothetical protein [Myxococcales bacterium]